MKKPMVSVVIPVKNEAANIRKCLDGILNQTVKVVEIVAVDSGSTDGTLDILKEYEKVKILQIKPTEFNHGLTRNLGVQHTRGDLVVLTVGDARPTDDRWLERMMRHFEDPEVAGVCGQQVVPHQKDKNPHQWYRPQNPARVIYYHFPKHAGFESLSPKEQWEACRWDDVTAMYRRDCLIKIPFRPVTYGEDMIWAREALVLGEKLVYDKSALVYHYHQVNFDFQYKRTLTVLYHIYKYFKYIKTNPFKISDPFRVIYRNIKFRAHIKWLGYNLIMMAATHKAHRDIRKWISMGGTCLDEMHEKVCSVAPQSVK